MNFTKIKVSSKGRVLLSVIERVGDKYTEKSLDSPDEPRIELPTAMAKLRDGFLKICELPNTTEMLARVHVHTISISYKGESHIPQVIISANIALTESCGSYNVNTPLRQLEGEGALMINEDMIPIIEEVFYEARKFWHGERNQLQLFASHAAEQQIDVA